MEELHSLAVFWIGVHTMRYNIDLVTRLSKLAYQTRDAVTSVIRSPHRGLLPVTYIALPRRRRILRIFICDNLRMFRTKCSET
jgi:hypothetical protein